MEWDASFSWLWFELWKTTSLLERETFFYINLMMKRDITPTAFQGLAQATKDAAATPKSSVSIMQLKTAAFKFMELRVQICVSSTPLRLLN